MRRWHLLVVMAALGVSVLSSRAMAAPAGTIAAHPNPCVLEPGKVLCTTYITWETHDVTHAKVFVVNQGKKAREEREFGGSRACEGEKCRAPWIEKGNTYIFRLYDYSSGSRGKNLAAVEVTASGGK